MDMAAPVSPFVLHAFYILMLKEFGVLAALVLVVWIGSVVLSKYMRADGSRNMEESGQSTEADSRAHAVLKIRTLLSRIFGGLWILDGLLQAQPDMSNQFISALIQPLVQTVPAVLTPLFLHLIHVWNLHPLLWDSLAVYGQILIGILMLFVSPDNPLGRVGISVSLAWALVIWVFGEGMGNIFGGATWLTGAPGSALLYALAAVLLLQSRRTWITGRVARWLSISIGCLWFLCAFLQAWPAAGFWQPVGLENAILPMAQMKQPSFVSAPIYGLADVLGHRAVMWNGDFVIVLVLLGALWIFQSNVWWLGGVTIVFTALTWWIGQDFGVIGGLGTDPNTGAPLLVFLFTWCALSRVKGGEEKVELGIP